MAIRVRVGGKAISPTISEPIKKVRRYGFYRRMWFDDA